MSPPPPTIEDRPPQPRRTRWGFVLALLFGMALILLIGIVVPAILGGPRSLKRGPTEVNMTNLLFSLDTYKNDTGSYPTTAQSFAPLIARPPALPNWNGPYIETIPNDEWGHPIEYLSPPSSRPGGYTLRSAGPDGVFGTADDIVRSGG